MTTVGGSPNPAIFSTSTGDGEGVTISSVTRFRDAFMEIQAGLLHGSLASLDQANATMQQVEASTASRATTASARNSRTSGRRGTRSPTTRAIPECARCCCSRRDSVAVELQLGGDVAPAPADQRDHAARCGRHPDQHDVDEPGAPQPVDSERHRRRPQRQHARGPARPARAEARAAHRRHDPSGPEQPDHGLARRAQPRVREPVAGARRSTRADRLRCCVRRAAASRSTSRRGRPAACSTTSTP